MTKPNHRRWEVYLGDERIGEVLAATERAACLRAMQRFNIKGDDRRGLAVRRATATAIRQAATSTPSTRSRLT